MTPPPAPALVVAGGLAWNLARSQRNRRVAPTQRRPTFCRWVAPYKVPAAAVAAGAGTWLTVHLARYVIEEWADVPTPL